MPFYYHLIPGCTGPSSQTMALSIDKNQPTGNLIITPFAANDPAQIWETAFYAGSASGGLVLINKMTGLAAYAPENDGAVTQIAIAQLGGNSTWTLGGGPGAWAIRPFANDDMNLNVAGNGPYPDETSVLVWGWSGGEPNEVWAFQPAGH